MKRLRYVNFQTEPGPQGAKALLTVKFMDHGGEVYSWMPRWADTEQLFLKAINTEQFNKPESDWLPRFAKTVRETAEGVNQSLQDAYKVSGQFVALNESKLVISDGKNEPPEEVTPLFPLTIEFLDEWLGVNVEVLIVNGVGVQIGRFDDWGQTRVAVYPPVEPPTVEVDDMPF